MRVGICFLGNPPQSGGGYTYEQELLMSFLSVAHESRHDYVILSNYGISGLFKDHCPQNVSNIIIPEISKFGRFINYLFISTPFFSRWVRKFSIFNKLTKKNKIEMLVFLSPTPEPTDCPFLTPVWDLQHRLQPWFPEVCENGIWDGRENSHQVILKRATIILTGTQEGQNEISVFYGIPKNRIKILPFPTPSFCLTSKKGKNREDIRKFQINGDYLLYPAQFWSHKNHINCIYALKILHQQYNLPLSLVFVGSDKGNLSYIRKIILDQNLTEFVHILGFVSREDLISLYQNAYSLVFPTFFGPDNLPPLEAFALGCPVIASNISGAEEQLGDAALLVDPKSPEQIANAIFTLFNSPDLRKTLTERGLKRAQTWTGPDFVRSIFQILDEFEGIRRCWE
jgi:glycosyltransferase involved in cell wall biosynthesis